MDLDHIPDQENSSNVKMPLRLTEGTQGREYAAMPATTMQ